MSQFNRRQFLKGLGLGGAAVALSACGSLGMRDSASGPHVVIVGGGPGGATTAKYLKRFEPNMRVTLIEPNATYHTCFGSNWVLGGMRSMDDIAQNYGQLIRKYGIKVVRDRVNGVDADQRRVTLASGEQLSYDKLVVAPGIDFRWETIEGLDETTSEAVPHAWKAGQQTRILKRQLEAMPDGGVFAMVVPGNPFRCPPGPYERASLVAHYLKQHKPHSKVLILDNKEGFSKQGLFQAGWKALYGDMIEWVPGSQGGAVERVDAKTRTAYADGGLSEFRADVLNYIPAQRAGKIAQSAGLIDESGWCPVDQLTFQSTMDEHIHVIGDASIAGAMPKSGHSANSQGKLTAAAIIRSLDGLEMVTPSHVNTCYSLVGPDYGISVAAVYRYSDGAIRGVEGSGGVSPADVGTDFRKLEANYARGWYDSITSDIWG